MWVTHLLDRKSENVHREMEQKQCQEVAALQDFGIYVSTESFFFLIIYFDKDKEGDCYCLNLKCPSLTCV